MNAETKTDNICKDEWRGKWCSSTKEGRHLPMGSKVNNAETIEFRLVRWMIGRFAGIVLETGYGAGFGVGPGPYGSYLVVAG